MFAYRVWMEKGPDGDHWVCREEIELKGDEVEETKITKRNIDFVVDDVEIWSKNKL